MFGGAISTKWALTPLTGCRPSGAPGKIALNLKKFCGPKKSAKLDWSLRDVGGGRAGAYPPRTHKVPKKDKKEG